MNGFAPVSVAALLSAAALPAQQVTSGPEKGRELGPLRVAAVVGPRKGQEYDAVAEMRKGPAAILFVHEVTRNVAPILRAFDELVAEFAVLGQRGCIVRLDDDRTEAERHMPMVSQSLRLVEPIVVSVDGAEGPGSYALNRKAALTLVLAVDGVVQESIGFTDTGRQDVPLLRLAFESIAGPLPESDEALRAELLQRTKEELADLVVELEARQRALQRRMEELQQRLAEGRAAMRRGMQRGRDGEPAGGGTAERGARSMEREAAGAAPADAELSRLIRTIVRKDVAAEELEAAFSAVDARVAEQADLRAQAVAMFERMLDRPDYGEEPAREKARAWLAHNRR